MSQIAPIAWSGQEWTWLLASYALGCFTAGYYWTRWRTGRDIRGLGSGNVGARNVGRTLGTQGFLVTFLLDFAKGMAAVTVANTLRFTPEATIACLFAVVAGHNWPMQLGFRGGKGISVSLGGLLAYEPFTILALVLVFLPALAVLRRFTLAGLAAFCLAPLLLFLGGLEKEVVAAVSGLAVLALLTHRRNLREELARLIGHPAVKDSPAEVHKGPTDEV
ncbi:MAG: hypothetical protein RJA22_355 [Verrucomicrobiota bacterium]|jgi:glycerol-3-phosphate acyltransferase PlsY